MLTSLGFDTLIIHTNRFYSNLDQTLEYFYNLGIKNFLFLFDYDPLSDSISITKSKMTEFKNNLAKTSPRRIKIKSAINLHISKGAAFNDSLDQLYYNKSSKAIFLSLPLFIADNYEPISLDINHILYKKSAFPIFTSFEEIVESSSIDFCSKFISNPKICLSIDLNYLLNPNKEIVFNKILNDNSYILPSISYNIANYAGILSATDFAIEKYGKKAYFNICSQINRTSTKIAF